MQLAELRMGTLLQTYFAFLGGAAGLMALPISGPPCHLEAACAASSARHGPGSLPGGVTRGC
jgi:hypothetical protein